VRKTRTGSIEVDYEKLAEKNKTWGISR